MNFLEQLFVGWRMVQWLSAGTALAEDWTSVPGTTHVSALQPPSFQLRGDAKLLVSPVLICK